MRFKTGKRLDFSDVLILPKRSTLTSRSQVDLVRQFTFRNSKRSWEGVPVIVANMDTTGTFDMARALFKHRMITCVHKHYTVEEWEDFLSTLEDSNFDNFCVSSGIRDHDFEKLDNLLKLDKRIKLVCLDVANGYTQFFIDRVKMFRERYPDKILIAGNVVTSELIEELLISGADIIKCGIGPGSVCTTRIKTGVGCPQLSTVIECADSAHGLKGHIVSDGGCTNPGDVSKAFGAGADFVMLGGMFAGHDESAGELVEENGFIYKEFYGMSSSRAMNKYNGKVAKYRASEGKRVLIKYRGPVDDTVQDILGGVRSTCTYVGAEKLKGLTRRTTFILVNNQSNEVYGSNR